MGSKLTFGRGAGLLFLVAALASGTASASSGSTPQGLKAEGLRWQAIADRYQQLDNRPAASFYTPQALRAEGLRWQAMARTYQQQRPSVVMASPSTGFDWGDAGIGAAGGLGIAVCGAGLILVARRSRRTKLAL